MFLPMIRRSGVLRRALLLPVVAIVSASAALVAASTFAASAATSAPAATPAETRSVSCQGFNFTPLETATESDFFGAKRFRAGTGGSGFFVCNPGLPHRAVVTKVQVSVWDGSGSSEVKYCGLYRSGLASAASSESVQELAALPATGLAQAPGFARLTDTSIQNATIDTNNFAYWLQCNLGQAGQSLGIYGANVVYTISAANG